MAYTILSRSLLCAGLVMLAGCGDDSDTSGATSAATNASGTGGSGPSGPTTTSGPGGGGATGTGGGSGGEAPVVETYHRVGRFEESDPSKPQFTWSGTSIGARIDGPSVSVELDGAQGAFFQVVVDGAPTDVFETNGGQQTYPLASGLPAGPHDVEIYRRTEGFTGVVEFHAFVPADGATLVDSPSPYKHKIEFIGDSITCGYGVEGPNGDCNFTPDTESAYLTYAAIASRNTNAAAHLIAYSGKGVFQNYGGDKNQLMPELYLRTLTDDASKPWDFASWVADAVVVNLGTNDFSAPIAHDDFVSAYVALLQTVRSKYPNATIFAVAWTGWGADKDGWVKDALTMSGDADAHYVEFSIDGADGFGCDYHPSKTTHEKLGALLTTELQQQLGW